MAYTPLDIGQNLIRLIHLSPATPADGEIRCRLSIALLDDKPQYEALSYVWGDINNTRYAEVDGHSFPITVNLHSVLSHLRLQDQERILWVDALCINQTDLRERMHQVSRMSYIYGQASQVIVWLDEGWPGSDMAMHFLRSLGEDETLHLDPSQKPTISVNGLNLDSSELCGHLIRLFDLPWWKRTWTIQEFVLAKKLVFQCARSLVTRETMYMARENFWSHKDRCCLLNKLDFPHPELGLSLSESFVQPAKLDFISKTRGHSYNVLAGIAAFCKREVTDPRDKVYGMLGLGTGQYANLVEPDYTLSPEKVCEAVAIKSVERTGKLEFLSHLFEHQNSKLPSFIPDWTGLLGWSEIYESRLGHVNWFCASRDMPAELKIICHGMLAAQGVIFDKIIATGATSLLEYTAEPGSLKELHRLAGLEKSSEELYCHTSDSRLVAFWHTLCGGMEMFLKDSNRYSRRLRGSTDLSRYSKWAAFFTASPRHRAELWDNETGHILLDIQTATHGRRFFTTSKGYFGFAPQKCKEGDLVVVLAGGSVPYIIRPASPARQLWKILASSMQSADCLRAIRAAIKLCSKTCYTILGDSYVHGIMDGELFELPGGSERALKEIVLV
jgi:Heterokaryon incompatibility protein (HET)